MHCFDNSNQMSERKYYQIQSSYGKISEPAECADTRLALTTTPDGAIVMATKTLPHRQIEALDRAISSASFTNYRAITLSKMALSWRGTSNERIAPEELDKLIKAYLKEHRWECALTERGCV
jgi:hypothetical protein